MSETKEWRVTLVAGDRQVVTEHDTDDEALVQTHAHREAVEAANGPIGAHITTEHLMDGEWVDWRSRGYEGSGSHGWGLWRRHGERIVD